MQESSPCPANMCNPSAVLMPCMQQDCMSGYKWLCEAPTTCMLAPFKYICVCRPVRSGIFAVESASDSRLCVDRNTRTGQQGQGAAVCAFRHMTTGMSCLIRH